MSYACTAAQVTTFLDGLYTLPYALPGSPFAKALEARDTLLDVMRTELRGMYDSFMHKVGHLWGASCPVGLREMCENRVTRQGFEEALLPRGGKGVERQSGGGESGPHGCCGSVMAPGGEARTSARMWLVVLQSPTHYSFHCTTASCIRWADVGAGGG